MRARVHGLLLLYALALAAAAGVAVLALGLPLAARHALGPLAVAAMAGAVSLVVVVLALALLARGIGAPVERLLRAAARLGATSRGEALPVLGEPGGLALSRAAVAFERVAAALSEEQGRLATRARFRSGWADCALGFCGLRDRPRAGGEQDEQDDAAKSSGRQSAVKAAPAEGYRSREHDHAPFGKNGVSVAGGGTSMPVPASRPALFLGVGRGQQIR